MKKHIPNIRGAFREQSFLSMLGHNMYKQIICCLNLYLDIRDMEDVDEDVLQGWNPYSKDYDPLKAGSIDGTDTEPHDKAISRAMITHYEPPHNLESRSERTIFVARFGPKITKHDLKEFFNRYGDVISAKVIVDIVTGLSQGYGFVEMRSEEEVKRVLRRTTDATLKGYKIFIDRECDRSMKGWKPRRLGGGFGGKKESGQLRFGGIDRPFKRPIVPNILKSTK